MAELADTSSSKYPYKTKPFVHQQTALRMMWGKRYFALLMEQGTGKTKVILDELGAMWLAGRVSRLLVLAPNGVHANWEDEIETHLPTVIPRRVLVWDSDKLSKSKISKARKEQLVSFLASTRKKGLLIFLVNIEGMIAPGTVMLCRDFLLSDKTAIVLDESSRIKDYKSNRTKKATQLGRLGVYKRILTGTPVTQGPLDVYAQFRFLSEEVFGTNWHVFRHKYADWSTERNPQSGARFEQIVAFKNLPDLQKRIAPISFRITKEECLDLPPKLYTINRLEMTSQQAKIYQAMSEELLFLIDREDLTPANILVKLLRLQQICGGFLPSEDDGITSKDAVPIEGANPKLALLVERMDGLQGKAIVWARFRAELDFIERRLAKAHGKDAVVTYHGGTSAEQRKEAVRRFQDSESGPRFFVSNPRAGGMGITLTIATTVVYFSSDFSLETRLQSEDRAHRIGQKKKVHYIDLIMRDSIDEQVLGALKAKRSIADALVGPGVLARVTDMLGGNR